MIVTLSRQYRFEASHRLAHLPPEHPCHHLHGHGYTVEIEVQGEVNTATGFLIDYADIDRAISPLLVQLDHKHLNDIPDLQFSTTEHLCGWIWKRLKTALPELWCVSVSETPTSRCEYRGDEYRDEYNRTTFR